TASRPGDLALGGSGLPDAPGHGGSAVPRRRDAAVGGAPRAARRGAGLPGVRGPPGGARHLGPARADSRTPLGTLAVRRRYAPPPRAGDAVRPAAVPLALSRRRRRSGVVTRAYGVRLGRR